MKNSCIKMIFKIFMLFVLFISSLSCDRNNIDGIIFKLGDSKTDVINYLQINNIRYREVNVEEGLSFALRCYDLEFDDIKLSKICLQFIDDELFSLQYRIHGIDNINKMRTLLEKKYGSAISCKGEIRYWGNKNSRFIIEERCFEDYYKFYFADSEYSPMIINAFEEITGEK